MTREELFNNLKGGARWDVGVSINRSNSLPLDAHSLFQSYEAAEAYASKDASKIAAVNTKLGINLLNNAYIGQIVAVVEDKTVGEETVTTVGLYYIDAALKLQPVGKEVVADEKTIINDNGTIKLYGFESAATATYPRKKADGTLEWVTVQELVEGATENTVTVGDGKSIVNEETDNGYKVSLNGYDAATAGQVPSKTATGLSWIDVYTKSEIDAKVSGVLSYKGVASGAPTDNGTNILVGNTTHSASNANIGHVYAYEGREYVSNGLKWEELGDSTDLSAYYTSEQVDAAIDADVLVETNRATEAEGKLSDRITTLEKFDHSVYATNARVEEAEGRIATVEGGLTTLQGTVSTEQGKLSTLQGTVSTLSGTVDGHTTVINGLDAKFAAKLNKSVYDEYVAVRTKTDVQIGEDIAAATEGLADLKTDVSNLKTTVGDENSGLVKSVAELTSKAGTNAQDIVTLKATLNGTEGNVETGLVSKVSKLEQADADHKVEYNALLGVVNGHTARFANMGKDDTVVSLVDAAKADAKAADDKAVAAANAVSTLETTKVKANADAISALDERVTALDKAADGKIATIEGAISGLDTRLTALDKDNGRIALIEGRVAVNEGEITAIKGQLTGLTGAMHFRGSVTADPTVTAPTLDPAAASGDVVLYDGKEYIYDGSKWAIFGDEGSYALKNNVYTKEDVYTKAEVNNLQTAQNTAHEALIAAAEGRAAEDATSKANAAEANAKAYTDTALTWTDMPELDAE